MGLHQGNKVAKQSRSWAAGCIEAATAGGTELQQHSMQQWGNKHGSAWRLDGGAEWWDFQGGIRAAAGLQSTTRQGKEAA